MSHISSLNYNISNTIDLLMAIDKLREEYNLPKNNGILNTHEILKEIHSHELSITHIMDKISQEINIDCIAATTNTIVIYTLTDLK